MCFSKKCFKRFILVWIFALFINSPASFANEPTIYSQAAILMDSKSGNIIYEKNSNTLMYPASTTKILTAILAIENCELSEKITASEAAITAIKSGYTNAKIQVGETLSMEDLLYALLLKSANEAANVIAERVGGTTQNFANIMNAKAIELGCSSTHFVNSNGIHDDSHYTTAHDLAIMTKYCMQNETFRKIICTKEYTLPATEQYPSEDRILKNTNSLMSETSQFYYPYVIAGKTGFTTQAKNCLISIGQKDGVELICVVLHAETTEDGRSARYLDTIHLFEYGFSLVSPPNNLENETKINATEVSKEISQSAIPTDETPEETSRIDFKIFIYVLLVLIFLRLLILYVYQYRAEKIKKRAKKYLKP